MKSPKSPARHAEPTASVAAEDGLVRPVCILESALAQRFAGFATIQHELLICLEMLRRAEAESDKLLVSALWRAAVAMYARCFSDTGPGMPKLEVADHLQSATPSQLNFHEQLIDMRHNFLSHAGHSPRWKHSAQVILHHPKHGRGIFGVFAGNTVNSVPSPDELRSTIALIELVVANAMSSMKKAHLRLKHEVEGMDLNDLYARAQTPGA